MGMRVREVPDNPPFMAQAVGGRRTCRGVVQRGGGEFSFHAEGLGDLPSQGVAGRSWWGVSARGEG